MPAPAEFVIPTIGEATAQAGVLNAVAGAVGTQRVEFFMWRKYDGRSSEKLDRDVYMPVEMVRFKNDVYSEYTCLVKDMNQAQRFATGPLYQRFKEQKDSTDTNIEDWDQIDEGTKMTLIRAGFLTVEQIAAHGDHESHKLGLDGHVVLKKARRTIAGKEAEQKAKESSELREARDEMLKIVEENKRLKEEMEKAKEEYFARQAAIGKTEKGAPVRA